MSVGIAVCDDFAVGLLGCVAAAVRASHCAGALKSGRSEEELRCGGLVWDMQYAGVEVVSTPRCGVGGGQGWGLML